MPLFEPDTSTIMGSGAATQVAFWASASLLTSSPLLTFNSGTGVFTANGFSVASADLTLTDGNNLVLGSTNGTKIGTATTQKLGFFNATPIVQPNSTTDLRTALINLGLLATGGASPLNLNGGALTTSGTVTFTGTTSVTGLTFDDSAAIRTLIVGSTNGTKIGALATSKLAFFGATPIVQPSAWTQTYSTTSKTTANPLATAVATTAATNVTPFGYTTAAQADAIRASVNNLVTDVANIKNNLSSLIDDFQALGLAA